MAAEIKVEQDSGPQSKLPKLNDYKGSESSDDDSDDEWMQKNILQWYECVICNKPVAKDSVEKLPCLHLICGAPRNCYETFLDTMRIDSEEKIHSNEKHENYRWTSYSLGPSPGPRPRMKQIVCKSQGGRAPPPKMVKPKYECPSCKLKCKEEDICDGSDEGNVMLAITKYSHTNCFCTTKALFQCDKCIARYCEKCYKGHEAVPQLKNLHACHKIGEEIFMCGVCEKKKAQFVAVSGSGTIFLVYCDSCNNKEIGTIPWKDHLVHVNKMYSGYINTLRQIENDALQVKDLIKAKIPLVNKEKRTILKSLDKMPISGMRTDDLKAKLKGLKDDLEKDRQEVHCIASRARQLKSYFECLMNCPCGQGMIKFKNFEEYQEIADKIVDDHSERVEILLREHGNKSGTAD